jgi:hypothetical protein
MVAKVMLLIRWMRRIAQLAKGEESRVGWTLRVLNSGFAGA